MLALYARKLCRLRPNLPREDAQAIEEITGIRTIVAEAGQDIARETVAQSECRILVEGFACRYKLLSEGRRQITAFLLPGDACDLEAFVTGRTDQSIAALTRCTMIAIPHATLTALCAIRPGLEQALWCDVVADAAIAREWVVNVGQRSALQRVAHVLCEVFTRMDWAGLSRDDTFDWPVVQSDLSDATGVSAVHVNRALRQMKVDGLISYDRRTVRIHDLAALTALGGFDDNYLKTAA